MDCKFFLLIIFPFLIGDIVAQDRASIDSLFLTVKKIEFNKQNEAYFIYAKSIQTKNKFVILSPINRKVETKENLKRIKRGKTYLFKIEYLNKLPVILGSSGIFKVFGNDIFVKEEITWYGEMAIAWNLYGLYRSASD